MHREPTKRTGFILNQSPNTAINNSTFFAHLHQCYITFKVKTPSSTWICYMQQHVRQIPCIYFKYLMYNLQ